MTYTTPFCLLILFTSTLQASLISVNRVFFYFCGSSQVINIHLKRLNQLSRKLAGMREDSSDKLPFYLEREAKHCSPSLPHQTLSAVSACPGMLNHKQKVEGTSATDSKFTNTFQIQKTPTKQTHIKTNPDLHVKSWCIIKIHRILKENVYWTNLTSVLENFKVQEIELKKVSYAYQKKTQTIENQSAMDCSYWENFNIRLVPYLLAPYLENCSRMFIMGGKNNWLFSTKQNGLFVFIA